MFNEEWRDGPYFSKLETLRSLESGSVPEELKYLFLKGRPKKPEVRAEMFYKFDENAAKEKLSEFLQTSQWLFTEKQLSDFLYGTPAQSTVDDTVQNIPESNFISQELLKAHLAYVKTIENITAPTFIRFAQDDANIFTKYLDNANPLYLENNVFTNFLGFYRPKDPKE